MHTTLPLLHQSLAGQLLFRRLVADPAQWYFLYLPHCAWYTAPVLACVHGITRNAHELAMHFMPAAERHGVMLVVPLFAKDRHRRYQRLGDERTVARADRVFGQILDEVGLLSGASTASVNLFGYSAGAQFVHRYAFVNPQRVRAYVAAAAGWYTFPDTQMDYPRGLRSTHLHMEEQALLRVPASVMVGEKDLARDAALNGQEDIDRQQGSERFARGTNWIAAMRAAAAAHGLDTRIEFVPLPHADHSFHRCATKGGLVSRVFDALRLRQNIDRYRPAMLR